MPAVGLAVAALPTFAFADRLPRKYVILAGGTLTLAAIVGLIASSELGPLLVFAALFGAGEVVTGATGLAFLSEVTAGAARTRTFGVSFAVSALAGFVASVAGGALAAPVAALVQGEPHDVRTLRALLALAALIGGASGIPILALRTGGRPAHVEAPRHWGVLARLAIVWTAFGFGAGNFIPFINLFFAERFRLDFATVGVILGAINVGGALGALTHTRWAPRAGDVRAIAVVWVTSLPFALAGAFAPVALLAAAALVLRGVLMTSVQPTFDAFFLSRLPPHERSGGQALSLTVWAIAYGAGAFVSGSVRAALGDAGYTANLVTMVAAYACAIVIFVVFFGLRPRPVESA